MTPQKNLWPWAIILVFVLFISGTVSLVVMACSQKMDLVSADYYEQEIRFQHHLDQLDRTHRLSQDASVTYEPSTHRVRISLPAAAQTSGLPPSQSPPAASSTPDTRHSAPITGRIQLYRPSAAGLDRYLKLDPDSNGIQYLDVSNPGLWKVRVSWSVNGQDYFLDQSLVIPGN